MSGSRRGEGDEEKLVGAEEEEGEEEK